MLTSEIHWWNDGKRELRVCVHCSKWEKIIIVRSVEWKRQCRWHRMVYYMLETRSEFSRKWNMNWMQRHRNIKRRKKRIYKKEWKNLTHTDTLMWNCLHEASPINGVHASCGLSVWVFILDRACLHRNVAEWKKKRQTNTRREWFCLRKTRIEYQIEFFSTEKYKLNKAKMDENAIWMKKKRPTTNK